MSDDYSSSDDDNNDNSRVIHEYNRKIDKLSNTINSLRSEVNYFSTMHSWYHRDNVSKSIGVIDLMGHFFQG